jgi:hypothetical protein
MQPSSMSTLNNVSHPAYLATQLAAQDLIDCFPEDGKAVLAEQPDPLPTPSDAPISIEQWSKAMALISRGTRKADALKAAGICRDNFAAYLRLEPRLAQRYDKARAAGRRKNWPPGLLRSLERAIASGMSLRQACREHGLSETQLTIYVKLTQRDETLEQRYLGAAKARRLRALGSLRTYAEASVTPSSARWVRKQLHALRRVDPKRLRKRRGDDRGK